MASQFGHLINLPLDILVIVLSYLPAPDFLSLCGTCKALHQPSIRNDPSYWSHATRQTFRVPNQPVVESDGLRWQKLYRRLLTQSRVYTWGSNTHGCLGHHNQIPAPPVRAPNPGRPAPRRFQSPENVAAPVEMERAGELGIIADLQCGGWSTTLLNSKGVLYTVGAQDGMNMAIHSARDPEPLAYPSGFLRPQETYDPAVAIRQFSQGRSHILGLSDSGRIWSWNSVTDRAIHVTFLHAEVKEHQRNTREVDDAFGAVRRMRDRVKRVVAGWSKSSAYISGKGIVLWDPLYRDVEDRLTDTMLVMESTLIPKTGYVRMRGVKEPAWEASVGASIGAVVNHIILEHYVVFTTDLGKVFAVRIDAASTPVELNDLRTPSGTAPPDVQGSYQHFALLYPNGTVLTLEQAYLDTAINGLTDPKHLQDLLMRIPALQNNAVIQLAFGDHHFHALHSNGSITSYGTEPQSCGALGLAGEADPMGRLRGIRYQGIGRDGKLLLHAYQHGRRVWFEHEKREFLLFMASGGRDVAEAQERLRLTMNNPSVQGQVSEWIEQQGMDWDGPAEEAEGEDGLGAYFALSVAAAGWHSGALVLVNEDLARKTRQRKIVKVSAANKAKASDNSRRMPGAYEDEPDSPQERPAHLLDPRDHGASPYAGAKYIWADDNFPRLKLENGEEMPGEVPFSEWKLGRPTFGFSETGWSAA